MAHILPLNFSLFGVTLASIVNVSRKICSPVEGCQNIHDDADAVEQLLLLWENVSVDGQNATNNCVFDPCTGYFIFRLQYNLKHKLGMTNQIIDGIVSPAKGVGYGNATRYTIVLLNLLAKRSDPNGYARFRKNFICLG